MASLSFAENNTAFLLVLVLVLLLLLLLLVLLLLVLLLLAVMHRFMGSLLSTSMLGWTFLWKKNDDRAYQAFKRPENRSK